MEDVYLFGQFDEILGAPICPCPTGEDGSNGERKEGEFKQGPPGIVLMRFPDIT